MLEMLDAVRPLQDVGGFIVFVLLVAWGVRQFPKVLGLVREHDQTLRALTASIQASNAAADKRAEKTAQLIAGLAGAIEAQSLLLIEKLGNGRASAEFVKRGGLPDKRKG